MITFIGRVLADSEWDSDGRGLYPHFEITRNIDVVDFMIRDWIVIISIIPLPDNFDVSDFDILRCYY